MIGKLHAFENVSSGDIDNMETRPSHVRDEHHPAVQIREESIGELQDAVSRNLSSFFKRAYRYVGDPHDAEDAMQDALLSAYKHLDQFKGTARMTTWLTSIASNGELAQRVRCSLKSKPEIPPRMLVSPKGTTSASNPEGRIKHARLWPGTSPQLPAVSRLARFALLQLALLLFAPSLRAASSDQPVDASSLPDAPDSQSLASGPKLQRDPGGQDTLAGHPFIVSPAAGPCATCRLNWYQRFTNGPKRGPLTPRDKAWLAARNFLDPFSLVAVTGEAGISVAADSHSPYGPGMPGFGRSVGVGITEDMTGEFFGTFLIPSVVHQDPRYYRMEHAPIHRRVDHAIIQVFWTRGDNGRGMPNYANLVGFAFDDAVANLYIPGRETSFGASADRYAVNLASAPIGNFVNEFLPDVASHIHVQVAIFQRIINQVVKTESGGSL